MDTAHYQIKLCYFAHTMLGLSHDDLYKQFEFILNAKYMHLSVFLSTLMHLCFTSIKCPNISIIVLRKNFLLNKQGIQYRDIEDPIFMKTHTTHLLAEFHLTYRAGVWVLSSFIVSLSLIGGNIREQFYCQFLLQKF